jgi:hypothetical protein
MNPDKISPNNKSFSRQTTDAMRGSLNIADEIDVCDRIIAHPSVSEDVKEEIKAEKERLVTQKQATDNLILNNIHKNN